jgi:hypothetical protein
MTDDPKDLDRIDQEIRINELKQEFAEREGRDPHDLESESDGFWQHIAAFEGPWTTYFEQLVTVGVELPDPAMLSDPELTDKLWEVIRRLADRRVFLSRTDHLSDRELYTHLWDESLREGTPAWPLGPDSACHIDILGGCSEEDIEKQFRYYADDEDRAHWMKSFPDFEMPPHEDPPYDRDRHLPKSGF